MALGAGGEAIDLLPGVTLSDIESPFPNGSVALFQASASTGASSSSSNPGTGRASAQDAASGVANVNLAGFCDWSIRFSATGGAGAGKRGSGQGPFFVQLSPADPSVAAGVWSGSFTLSNQDGDSVSGILTGLLTAGSDQQPMFQGFLVATHSVGRWAAALGNGQISINWGASGFDGPFQADVELTPSLPRKGSED